MAADPRSTCKPPFIPGLPQGNALPVAFFLMDLQSSHLVGDCERLVNRRQQFGDASQVTLRQRHDRWSRPAETDPQKIRMVKVQHLCQARDEPLAEGLVQAITERLFQ